ncbi:MAG: 30S ribosomal protein S3 [Thermoplasmata archaeon]
MARERKFIDEKMNRVLLIEFLKSRTDRAGFGGCEVSRTPMGTRITLHIERPALVIGRKGRNIRKLTSDVKEKFNFDNPQIEVQEINVPELNSQIMASKLANSLERGWHFRRAGHSTVRRIMQSGARGCQIILSGKITGPRHRVEKFVEGHIKHCGEEQKRWMHEGFSTAKVKLGVIGVTVQIMDPNARLPDEIDVILPKKEPEEEAEEPEPEEEAEEPEPEEEAEEPEPEEEAEEPEPEEEAEEPEPEEEAEEPEPEEEAEKPEPEEEAEEPEPEEEAEEPEPEEEAEEPEPEEEAEEPEPEEEAEEPEPEEEADNKEGVKEDASD